jgi:hypothetical protein
LPTCTLNGRPCLSLTRGITSTLHVFFLSAQIIQHNARNRFRIIFSASPLSASLPCRYLIKPSVSSTLFTWALNFQACWKNFEKRLFISSRLSDCPHVTTRLPALGFSWNLIFNYFRKSIEKIKVFNKIGQV